MNCIFDGRPNSGKGSLAIMLAKKYLFTHLSTGDILREEIKKGTELGKEIDGFISSGNLVPMEIVNTALSEALKNLSGHKVIDGFPRTKEQAEFILEKIGAKKLVVVRINAPRELCKQRASLRRICKFCKAPQLVNETGTCDICGKESAQTIRTDDALIDQRLNSYDDETAKVYDFMASQGIKVITVNAELGTNAIAGDVIKFLRPYFSSHWFWRFYRWVKGIK